MTNPESDTDVLIVGAGPGGTAAALMAASLQLRTVLVEAAHIGGKLCTIDAVENVAGNWSSGTQLAAALVADLEWLRGQRRCSLIQARAVAVSGFDDRVEVTLTDGTVLTAGAAVVATGVGSLSVVDTEWATAPDDFDPPFLWTTSPEDLRGRTYVLGADRPLGTWLRSHAAKQFHLHVIVPPGDAYKAAEVADDDRLHILPVEQVDITRSAHGDPWRIEVTGKDHQRVTYATRNVLNNLGSKPEALNGLQIDRAGYCPTERQHKRIRVAGDLRSARFQRIATAQGSGAEAVLSLFYDNLEHIGQRE
ncbi:FAD-dependent oxidoreductase [Streptomyces nanshensis]|uniref:FAD-dependent oxidoreductase n=1 Tax=Streptomyces nanshensis TaxID=518642 RepID=UPI0009A09BFC|nr:FAD-dependent oxidoreductase [Streptomyces nanshensis]